MYKTLVSTLLMALVIAGTVFSQTSIGHDGPRKISDVTDDKILPPSVPMVMKADAFTQQPQISTPISGREIARFAPLYFRDDSPEVVIRAGPIQLVSRQVACSTNVVCYRTWERPHFTFWGFSPILSLRRDKYTHQYGFKIGFRKQF
jgi:hypothetical protein